MNREERPGADRPRQGQIDTRHPDQRHGGEGHQRRARSPTGGEILWHRLVTEGDVLLPGQGKVPWRICLEIATLCQETDAHGVRPQRRLTAGHVLVGPGRAERVGQSGDVVRP